MNNKLKMAAGAAGIIAIMAVGGTAAYFAASSWLQNQASVGENTIALTEDFKTPDEMHKGDNKYKKTVQVTNTGTVPCYVRVYADFSDSKIKEASSISSDGGKIYYPASENKKHPDEGWLPEGWRYEQMGQDDGYYYYITPIQPGDKTSPLFTNIDTKFEDEKDVSQYDVIVYAESVQTVKHDGTQAADYNDAWTSFLDRK